MKIYISIVIPTKNRPDFLTICLNSFKNFLDNIKIIVVDDGSNNDLSEKNRRICDSYRNCKYIFCQKSKGAPAARNLGFKHSVNNYVWFFDDDDRVENKTVEDVIHYLSFNKPDCLLVPMKKMYKNIVLGENKLIDSQQNFTFYRKYGHSVNTSCAIFSADFFEKIGCWDESLVSGQDSSLFLCAAKHGKISCVETDPVIVNIGHSNRITTNVVRQQFGKIQFILKHWNDIGIKRKVRYVISFLTVWPFFNIMRLKIKVNLLKSRI